MKIIYADFHTEEFKGLNSIPKIRKEIRAIVSAPGEVSCKIVKIMFHFSSEKFALLDNDDITCVVSMWKKTTEENQIITKMLFDKIEVFHHMNPDLPKDSLYYKELINEVHVITDHVFQINDPSKSIEAHVSESLSLQDYRDMMFPSTPPSQMLSLHQCKTPSNLSDDEEHEQSMTPPRKLFSSELSDDDPTTPPSQMLSLHQLKTPKTPQKPLRKSVDSPVAIGDVQDHELARVLNLFK
jgi:hypothetical protein